PCPSFLSAFISNKRTIRQTGHGSFCELHASAVNVFFRLGFDSVSMVFLVEMDFHPPCCTNWYMNYFAPWWEVARGNDPARQFQKFLL
ncbi:MAG: hypothetical protein WCH75_29330, partial [Candidatus Binatia bacterium]